MLYKKLGAVIILQLSQNNGKLPSPRLKQGNYTVILIYGVERKGRIARELERRVSRLSATYNLSAARWTEIKRNNWGNGGQRSEVSMKTLHPRPLKTTHPSYKKKYLQSIKILKRSQRKNHQKTFSWTPQPKGERHPLLSMSRWDIYWMGGEATA